MKAFDKLTIEMAIELRKELKLNKSNQQLNKYTYGERQVLTNILYGSYDGCKDETIQIAKEDIAFLDKGVVKHSSGFTNNSMDNLTLVTGEAL